MKLEMHIGQRVRAARERAGLTLEGLGQQLKPYLGRELTAQAVWQMERGMRDLKAVQIVALCLALDLPISYLFAATEDEPIVLEDGGKFEYTLTKVETDRVLRPTGHLGGWNESTYAALVSAEKTLRAVAEMQTALGVATTASHEAFSQANHAHDAVLAILHLGQKPGDD